MLSESAYLVYPAEDRAETGGECITFLGEEGVACLCSFQTELGVGQGHPRGEDVFSRPGSRHDGDRRWSKRPEEMDMLLERLEDDGKRKR